MTNNIGGKINKLSYKIKRKVCNLSSIKVINEISGTNSILIGYISRRIEEGYDVYQKDIEHEFGITRSTASKVITLMEKKELVIRVSVDGDARLKKLILTDKAEELNSKAKEEINHFDSKLLNGFSEKETNLLFEFLRRINKNLEEIEW